MSRTLGSIPWLIPSVIPSSSPANALVRCEGAFEININSTINVGTLFERRVEGAIPEKLELVVRHGKRTLTTKFVPVVDNNVVHFEGKFIFSTGPDGPYAKQCCNKCRQCCILKCACVSSSCSLRLSCLCFCTSNQSYCVWIMPYTHDLYQYPGTQQTQCACCSDNHLILSICEPGVKAVRQTKGRAALRERCCSFSTRRKWLKIIFCVSTLLCFFHLTSASCVWCIVFCLFVCFCL